MLKTKKKRIFVIIAALSIIALAVFFVSREEDPLSRYELENAQRGDIVEVVSITGTVKPSKEVSLGFVRAGKINAISVKVGDKVNKGKVLVSMDDSDIRAELSRAKIALEAEKINLENIKRAGARIAKNGNNISPDEAAVLSALNQYTESLKEAYTKTDNTVRTYVDKFFGDSRQSPHFGIEIHDGNAKYFVSGLPDQQISINREKRMLNSDLKIWRESTAENFSSDVDEVFDIAETTLMNADSMVQGIGDILDSKTYTSATEESIYKGLRSDLHTARSAIVNELSAIRLTKNNYLKTSANSSPEEIRLADLQVKSALANIASIEDRLSETWIASPFSGTVVAVNAETGEIASTNSPIVKMISSGQYEIEAFVPESDIAKVKVKDTAEVTLDAYGEDEIFEAFVASIDPAETAQEGISTYKIKLVFVSDDSRILSGMTANIDISTEKKEDVIKIPERAVIREKGEYFVRVVTASGTDVEKKKVVPGIRGADSYREIISGIKEGEQIVVFDKQE
ncbi:MAG: hypothetical protein A3G52_00390 [Candidatus Taylorbacteria bacterium RIFCSPLOWO2_12_FULL_43_20]|uniref:Uncharacterized protein n=1 Tax=Candidatus Taylorbacteria bacterium RIFCSPLOWO2_12_FULL_43_20 TaxID=1802332 RepID=A0A1G2P1G6_9BACT|nr:MAG: hypothetical protein A2825_01840 [Candidatus Taylorbacteria bacterium RIFCSPHIGHO2_01_FULL_43_120]OHA23318.1 MAG: hypothetical protein A3B98_03665 [Candidatus Taylorbacteria bacterium RIFCSPHIGHO2_02_FULL_43_55]OHA28940.1 MAG: hypothetical protein A3E92_04710 [Candidatus Taylorbacteria bacterium RIFCSPHIGHO2_12_FULL_42_34]OHA31445.1 MAG: hypothetical protein A3B09_03275 [Candidatus Taylorbacteria bacterium RIFCSPLOWO2_01_FULL_43_83]OHA37759.1 MAG: hypothetical protein A3H58_01240 [Candi